MFLADPFPRQLKTALYNEYRLYKRLTIVSKCSSSPLTFSSTCARWIGSLRTRSRHLWSQICNSSLPFFSKFKILLHESGYKITRLFLGISTKISKNHSAKFLFSPIDQLFSLVKVNSEICFHCVKVNHHIVWLKGILATPNRRQRVPFYDIFPRV